MDDYQVIEAFTGNREATSSRWRWPNCPRSFAIRNARPFSPISFKTLKTSIRHPLRQSGIPGSLLLRIWSLQSITYLKPFLRNFFVNTCVTLRAEVTRASKIWLWIFSACFTQITSSKIEHSIGFDWFFSFRWVRFRSIAELDRTQSMNWFRLSSIEFDWDLQ